MNRFSPSLLLPDGGHGFALIREGTSLDEELTTRPIAGVDWTVDTALIYHKVRHPKTVPILVKRLIKQFPLNGKETAANRVSISVWHFSRKSLSK